MTKQKKLRHSEYYDLQPVFDRLYADSQQGKIFTKLMDIISSEENIRLAYRNIKRNGGSNTAGTDKQTIKDIEKLPVEQYVRIVQRKLNGDKSLNKVVLRQTLSARIDSDENICDIFFVCRVTDFQSR